MLGKQENGSGQECMAGFCEGECMGHCLGDEPLDFDEMPQLYEALEG